MSTVNGGIPVPRRNSATTPLAEGVARPNNVLTKPLPQVCRNFISNKYPSGMETQMHISDTS